MGERIGIMQRSLSLAEVVVVIIVTVVAVAMLVPMFLSPDRTAAVLVKDATQLTQLGKAFDTFGRQYNDLWPRPGLINTLGSEPGIGDEDETQNTTANLFSALIAQNFFTPAIVVGTREPNPVVVAHTSYNLNAYQPVNDVYWDATFVADLQTGSNVSYAHLPLVGERGRTMWRDTTDPTWALLANRGPKDGIDNPKSLTYRIHGDGKVWRGHVLFADGSVEFVQTFTPRPPKDGFQDNIFADQLGTDIFLTFTKSVRDGKAAVQWD